MYTGVSYRSLCGYRGVPVSDYMVCSLILEQETIYIPMVIRTAGYIVCTTKRLTNQSQWYKIMFFVRVFAITCHVGWAVHEFL